MEQATKQEETSGGADDLAFHSPSRDGPQNLQLVFLRYTCLQLEMKVLMNPDELWRPPCISRFYVYRSLARID